MKKGDEASPIIILAGQALLVKMLITLEPCYVFGSNLNTFGVFFSFFNYFFLLSYFFLFFPFF